MNKIISIGKREIRITGRLLRIASMEGEKYMALDDPDNFVSAMQGSGVRIDLFTFMQMLPETSPKFSYHMESDNQAVLPVTTFEHWLNKQIRFAPRGRLRQAEKKGVTVREVPFGDDLIRGIWGVYNESTVRQGTRNVHYGKDIETVRKIEATYLDQSVFIGAFLENEMIGFVKLTFDESRTAAHLVNIVSMVRHNDKCPTNALIAQSVRSCAERGIGHLVYQKFSYGKKQMDGLGQFKKVNGFQKVDVPRYFIPLTFWGRIALRFDLHHSFSERIPEPIATRLRQLRRVWYNRKLELSEAS